MILIPFLAFPVHVSSTSLRDVSIRETVPESLPIELFIVQIR